MTNLTLLSYPKIEKIKAASVTSYNESLQDSIQKLYDVTEYLPSLCLAAPQVGLNLAIFVLAQSELSDTRQCFINPRIMHQENMILCESNCLYFGDVPVMIKRPQKLEISYFDENGTPQSMVAASSLAAILAYQIDCLNGVLVIDHMSKLKRDKFLKKHKKLILNQHQCGQGCHHEHHH